MRPVTLSLIGIVCGFWLNVSIVSPAQTDQRLIDAKAEGVKGGDSREPAKMGGNGDAERAAQQSAAGENIPQTGTVDLVSKLAEKVTLNFDGRPWGLGFSSENQGHIISEFVLPGETVHSWTELVTLHVSPPKQVKPSELMLNQKAVILVRCPDVKWSVMRKGKEEIIYEWQVTNCPGVGSEQEISKIIQGKTAIHRVAYTTKRVPMPEETRDTWTALIAKAKLASISN